MKVFDLLNNMNNGRGVRILTDAGAEEMKKRERAYKRANKIHWAKNCYDERWYKEIEAELYRPIHQNIFWEYARAVRRFERLD